MTKALIGRRTLHILSLLVGTLSATIFSNKSSKSSQYLVKDQNANDTEKT